MRAETKRLPRDQRRKLLEDFRINNAKKLLKAAGIVYTTPNPSKIQIMFNDEPISFWPYTGWHSGKSIEAGRGIENLLKQISDEKTKKMQEMQEA